MMIKLMARIMISVFGFVAAITMVGAAEQPSVQETQGEAKWTMTVDEGAKPLGKATPFITFKAKDESQIELMRFDVSPKQPATANLFADDQHQDDSDIGFMSRSTICLGVKASNVADFNKAKSIVDTINFLFQVAYESRKIEEKAKYEANSWVLKLNPVLPFRFSSYEQSNCFFAFVYLGEYEFLGEFIREFQNVFPELKSEVLDEGYSELVKRINRTK